MTPPVRDLTRAWMEGRLSRRDFLHALTGAGMSTAATRRLAAQLAPPESGEPLEATGGALMAAALERAGIRYVFGLPGTSEVGFLDALVDRPGLQYILGLHEGPLTAMADGYAKVSGQAAFVNVHTVVGTANAFGALVNAATDGTPLVLTAGTQDSRLRGRGAFLESPHLEMLPAGYAKWVFDIPRADRIPELLRQALAVASTPPRGPTFLTCASDMWKTTARATIASPERYVWSWRLPAASDLVAQAAGWLLTADYPLLAAGDELVKYGGRDELEELADLLGAPVVGELVTGHGLVTFPTRHPLYLGMFPGQRAFPLPIDLFLSAGARVFSEFDYQAEPYLAPQVRTVRIGLDMPSSHRAYPVDLAIVAHPAEALRALVEAVKQALTATARGQVETRRKTVIEARRRRDERLRRALEAAWNEKPLSPARLAAELNRAVDPDAIVVTELVTSDEFHFDYLDYHNGRPGRLHLASHGGHLGWAVGAACGAKLAAPDREVVCLVGDGGFQFGVQGLWTAARYEVPVLFVIFNNQNYQSNRLGLVRYGGRALATGRYLGSYLGDPEIDHAAIARGYGVESARVANPADLRAALEVALRAVRGGRPYVLEVAVARRFPGAEVGWYEKFSVASLGRGVPR